VKTTTGVTLPTIEGIFFVEYGNKLDMNKQTRDPNGVCFVGRKGNGQGVSGRVREIPGAKQYPAGSLTVALGGSRLLATFVQQEPFYTAQNVAVLTPRDESMSLSTRLFYAMAITANRYRYTAFGREANRTLRTIELPKHIPQWVSDRADPGMLATNLKSYIPDSLTPSTTAADPEMIELRELFNVTYGQSLQLNRLTRVSAPDGVNFVSRAMRNNGITARVVCPVSVSASPAGSVTVALSGNGVLSAFPQPEPFVCGFHVAVLTPKRTMTVGELLWWCHLIHSNAYRYSYGRQANRTLSSLLLPTAIPEHVNRVIESARSDKLFPSQRGSEGANT
jgi:hypothetical protein